jgi:hypothetical protein
MPREEGELITYVCYNSIDGSVNTVELNTLSATLIGEHGRVFYVRYYSDIDKTAFAVLCGVRDAL